VVFDRRAERFTSTDALRMFSDAGRKGVEVPLPGAMLAHLPTQRPRLSTRRKFED
jgi:hypothetical protein